MTETKQKSLELFTYAKKVNQNISIVLNKDAIEDWFVWRNFKKRVQRKSWQKSYVLFMCQYFNMLN